MSIALRASLLLASTVPLFVATAFHPAWWQTFVAAAIGSALGQLAVRATRGHRVWAIVVASCAMIIAAASAIWALADHRPHVDEPRFFVVRSVEKSLTWDDVREIQGEMPPAAPVLHKTAQLASEETNWNTQVVGTTPDYLSILGWPIASGRPLAASDTGKVVVLGDKVAAELFGANVSPIGAQIRIDRTPFDVIGVLAHRGMTSQGQDLDDTVLVPMEVFRARLGMAAGNRFGGVVFMSPPRDVAQLRALLRDRHRLDPGAEDDFVIVDSATIPH